MISHHIESKQWLLTFLHFTLDIILFALGAMLAIWTRFPEEWIAIFLRYFYLLLCTGVLCATFCYLSGFYTPRQQIRSLGITIFGLTGIVAVGCGFLVFLSYLIWIHPIGRGAFLLITVITYLLLLQHHLLLYKYRTEAQDHVLILVGSANDEKYAQALVHDLHPHLHFVGWILVNQYQPSLSHQAPLLGETTDLIPLCKEFHIERVVCSHERLEDLHLIPIFCRLRYNGIAVVSMISLYEEFWQICPLALLSPQWLLDASSAPYLFYLRTIKRSLDVVLSLTIGFILMPVFLLAILAQLIVHGRPIFYRQTRLGREGREFTIYKIRTMIVNAEQTGIQWAKPDDQRITVLGRFFRKFRIDEIPQLLNILKGEMSFVGPRPERPEFTEKLSQQIPFFLERLLVQPGLTGWAQVCYPYADSLEDSCRKLEYDLYYIKHMSPIFDLFILLDTIRIVILGGVPKPSESFISKIDWARNSSSNSQ